MKKLIAILFMFSVTFTINAQEYKIINAVYSIESDDIISFSRIIKMRKSIILLKGKLHLIMTETVWKAFLNRL